MAGEKYQCPQCKKGYIQRKLFKSGPNPIYNEECDFCGYDPLLDRRIINDKKEFLKNLTEDTEEFFKSLPSKNDIEEITVTAVLGTMEYTKKDAVKDLFELVGMNFECEAGNLKDSSAMYRIINFMGQEMEPEPEFKLGDVVALKSGSIAMTIGAIVDKNAICLYHNFDTNEFGEIDVPFHALKNY